MSRTNEAGDGHRVDESELEPIEPSEAVEMYLQNRKPELSEKSVQNHTYRLDKFERWCAEQEIENLNHLTGRDLHRYRNWRARDVATVTLVGELRTLRVFLEFCASIDAVESGLREKVLIPSVSDEEESKDVHIEPERAERILEHLNQFQYASRDHVVFAILWHTGFRLGTLRALDIDDFDTAEPCLEVRHRPESETPLKNGEAAERSIAVSDHYRAVIEDYIKHNRYDVTDDYGREPLITSEYGRLTGTAIRTAIYRLTQPCTYGECPHDREPSDCEYTNYAQVSECPSSLSPHTIRRGSITAHLREGTPGEVVSERMNVSADVLDKHYDERTEREKMRVRRDYLEGP
ncbi:tyrosine-type recombinase/integrase [Halosimplex pelagicum]|uniref:Site-specific integrase n=1 Tax=Halosimplex pelagicum TaxID=869886 RepID=A0A7D5TD92_9EURY|nr:site-specific integrase [Halosimplex pelagicum]QLH82795.1 site-specific integrase [Halosimplex pelagicum]